MKVANALYGACLEVGTLVKRTETEVDGMHVQKDIYQLNGKSYRFILVNGTIIDKRRFA